MSQNQSIDAQWAKIRDTPAGKVVVSRALSLLFGRVASDALRNGDMSCAWFSGIFDTQDGHNSLRELQQQILVEAALEDGIPPTQ